MKDDFLRWEKNNAVPQKQAGFVAVNISVPLGDITSQQMRIVAKISNQYAIGAIRTTNAQNIVIPWVPENELSAVYQLLKEAGLGMPCAHHICDVTACPGSSSCPSAITNSKALASELIRLIQNDGSQFQEIKAAIKVCGCQNSCGQHHIATIGFSGRTQMLGEKQIPCYDLYIGGNVGYGQLNPAEPVCRIPSKRVPSALSAILHFYKKEKLNEETLEEFIKRKGKDSFKSQLSSLTDMEKFPLTDVELKDWGADKNFQLKVNPSEC